jgi:hypothetical protein
MVEGERKWEVTPAWEWGRTLPPDR